MTQPAINIAIAFTRPAFMKALIPLTPLDYSAVCTVVYPGGLSPVEALRDRQEKES
jgi:hypothetical protein